MQDLSLQAPRLAQIMGRDDDGDTGGGEGGQTALEERQRLAIESGRRLVQQEDLGFQDQGPGQGDPPGFAAGKGVGKAGFESRQPDGLESPGDAVTLHVSANFPQTQAEGEVFIDAGVEQERGLFDQGDLPAQLLTLRRSLYGDAGEQNLSPVGRKQQREELQQGAFAGSVWTGKEVNPLGEQVQPLDIQCEFSVHPAVFKIVYGKDRFHKTYRC